MKTSILFKFAARCEAAGRPNNEDNYQLGANLDDTVWGFTTDEVVPLGEKGALMIVCDGMGGMNAGEVASAIAIESVKEFFAKDKITKEVLNTPTRYIHQAIVFADRAIKKHSKDNPETEGMGSTIVLAWLLGEKVHVGWCGDSRVYRYNPVTGLERLSHDHSYVQELVDAGKLTEDLAFDHPNSNIITRSLGDPRGDAQPDVKSYDLHDNDILLLCSDGLCGCLRDSEIEAVVAEHTGSMKECRDALWVADEAAGWHDNVTIALAKIESGVGPMPCEQKEEKGGAPASILSNSAQLQLIQSNKKLKRILGCLIALLLIAGGVCGGWILKSHTSEIPVQKEKGSNEDPNGSQLIKKGEEEVKDKVQNVQSEQTSSPQKESFPKSTPKTRSQKKHENKKNGKPEDEVSTSELIIDTRAIIPDASDNSSKEEVKLPESGNNESMQDNALNESSDPANRTSAPKTEDDTSTTQEDINPDNVIKEDKTDVVNQQTENN